MAYILPTLFRIGILRSIPMPKTTLKPILLIIAWSLLVHVPGIRSPLMDYQAYRQCQTASMARNYVRHGMHFFSPELDT